MHRAERRRRGGKALSGPRAVMATVVVLVSPLLWLTVVPCAPAQGVVRPTVAAHPPRADASGSAHPHVSNTTPEHKEGPVAVAASVIGIIVVVVCIVGLGSLSVRRRTRDRPPPREGGQGGPPGRGPGPFDGWFKSRG
jgi:hypothetical protein